MKLRSIHMRGEGHKAQKDAADTFALIVTYSGGARELVDTLGDRDLGRRFLARVGQFDAADWAAIEAGTGAPRARIQTTLAALGAEPRPRRLDAEGARSKATELRRRGAEILARQNEAKGAHAEAEVTGDIGSLVGGEVAKAAGLSVRSGKKWGRRIATARPRWEESPAYISIASNVDEWLRALKAFVEEQEGPGPARSVRGRPLATRYARIFEAQTLPARVRRGLVLLDWALQRLGRP